MKQKILIGVAFFALAITSCTKLEEKLTGDVNLSSSATGGANVPALLKSAYNSMRSPFHTIEIY